MTIRAASPAKINTFLAVGPPDRKGWHPLRTVFQAVSLADEVELEVNSSSPGVVFEGADIPEQNTVAKALRLAQEAIALPPVRVTVRKRIPMESGLGGGSSNAAAVLRALAKWRPDAFPGHFLHEAACSIGADVPFFLVGGRARGEGYGDRLTPLPDLPPAWLVIARPSAGCPTPEAYRRLDQQDRPWVEFPAGQEDSLAAGGHNDFMTVSPPECGALAARLMELGADAALLTGSGSAVFGHFGADSGAASAAVRALELEGTPFACRCCTLTRDESLWTS